MLKHPERSWGIILQQAWPMGLQDRVIRNGNIGGSTMSSTPTGMEPTPLSKKKKICWDYNSGKCTFGFSCKFDHRCGICGKLGHGLSIVKKLNKKKKKHRKPQLQS